MKYFSMFSGIGGFEKGIEGASRQAICIGYSEINKYANAIYSYHYPKHTNYGDAKELVPESIPDFDILVGGFPCQAFSIAGKRRGFEDTRGTLFFDVARVLKAKKPEWLLLENVKGLCSHESGKTLATVHGVLADLGYTVGWEVVNSCQFGVPQNRERIFIVGHLATGGGGVGEILPIREEHSRAPRIQRSAEGERERVPGKIPQGGRDHVYPKGGRRGGGRPSSGIGPGVMVDSQIRRLTPIECERLQGFPDNWTKYGIIGGKKVEISDTQRYKCLGNAVTVNIVEAIMGKIYDSIHA